MPKDFREEEQWVCVCVCVCVWGGGGGETVDGIFDEKKRSETVKTAALFLLISCTYCLT